MELTFIIILIIMSSSLAKTQSLYEKRTFVSPLGVLPYRMLFPENYDEKHQYPLILVLHGAGEKGTDNEKQLVHGGPLFSSDSVTKLFPAIVIFPQCPREDFWADARSEYRGATRITLFQSSGEPTKTMKMLLQLVDSFTSLETVDKKRMYAGGLSMGGMGTFELLYHRPIFAAAFPICGGGNPAIVNDYNKQTSFWVFHGKEDKIVPHKYSDQIVRALKENNFDVRYSLYPEVEHNSWENAFHEPNLLPWLFSKSIEK